MAPSKFRKIAQTDPLVSLLQDSCAASIDLLLGLPLNNALLLLLELNDAGNPVPLTLSSTAKNVPHGLGREPNGWVVVSPDAPCEIHEDASSNNPDKAKFLRLISTADVTVKILVF